MTAANFLVVALGSALGGAGRYAVSMLPLPDTFPWQTFIVNVTGAALIGLIAGLAGGAGASGPAVLFWKTGVCGGFTTFSTFSLEAYNLLAARRYLAGGTYIALSVAASVCGVLLGLRLAQIWSRA